MMQGATSPADRAAPGEGLSGMPRRIPCRLGAVGTPRRRLPAAPRASRRIRVRALGRVPYTRAWAWMRAFTGQRGPGQPDEIWWLEHPPVYTLGLSRSTEDLLDLGGVELVYSDRGGRASYHGPGQLLVYPLVDLGAAGLGPRAYIRLLEESVIAMLAGLDIEAGRRQGAPGVYTGRGKIAFVGVRVRRHCAYHGLALNVAPDLAPFARIRPCGLDGLSIDSLAARGCRISVAEAAARLVAELSCRLDPPGRQA